MKIYVLAALLLASSAIHVKDSEDETQILADES